MIEEGTYQAVVRGCFTGESTEKKTPFIGIEFETIATETEKAQTIYWNGYLTETEFTKKDGKTSTPAKENLLTLVQLGYKGKRIADMSDESIEMHDLFDKVDNINIIVEHEEFTNDEGEVKCAAKVKFINVGYGNLNKFDHKQAVAKFKSCTFDGTLMGLKKDTKVKASKKEDPETKKEEITKTIGNFDDDEIPF